MARHVTYGMEFALLRSGSRSAGWVTHTGGKTMKRFVSWFGVLAFAVVLLAGPGTALAKDDPAKYGARLTEAKDVFTELMTSADHKVPEKLLHSAKCVVVIPDMVKGALGFGARWGNGVMSCRNAQPITRFSLEHNGSSLD